MKPLNRDPAKPRKLRSTDISLGYDEGPKVIHRAQMPSVASTPVSRTAHVIEGFLASGPKTRREVQHHFTIRNCEEGTLEAALALLGCVQQPTMFLPRVGQVMMVGLRGARIEKRASDPPFVEPRVQRRPRRLTDRRV
jgi:hypothetical protein